MDATSEPWHARTAMRFPLWLVGFVLLGCGQTVTVRASRYTAAPTTDYARPLCFAPMPKAGLAARARYQDMVDACSEAAVAEGVSVGSGSNCLVATVQFSSEDTGRDLAECGPKVGFGAECESRSVFSKGLKLTLVDPASKRRRDGR